MSAVPAECMSLTLECEFKSCSGRRFLVFMLYFVELVVGGGWGGGGISLGTLVSPLLQLSVVSATNEQQEWKSC